MRFFVLLIPIIFLLILGFKLNYIYLLFFTIGYIFLLLLVLSIERSVNIFFNYCERKKIIDKNKSNMSLFCIVLTIIIITVYIVSIYSRLFIIISNICKYFFIEISEREYLSLNIYMIILILAVCTLLSWGDIMNKKYETGKYSKISFFFAILITLSLLLSLILWIISWDINYLYILNVLAQSTIIEEIFSIFINSELVLFTSLEKTVIPFFNINNINIKWNELKKYINITLFKNNSVDRKSNINSYMEYKKFFSKGRNGNIIRRSMQFIIDLIYLMRKKIYQYEYIIKLNNIYKDKNFSFSKGYILAGTPSTVFNIKNIESSPITIHIHNTSLELNDGQSIIRKEDKKDLSSIATDIEFSHNPNSNKRKNTFVDTEFNTNNKKAKVMPFTSISNKNMKDFFYFSHFENNDNVSCSRHIPIEEIKGMCKDVFTDLNKIKEIENLNTNRFFYTYDHLINLSHKDQLLMYGKDKIIYVLQKHLRSCDEEKILPFYIFGIGSYINYFQVQEFSNVTAYLLKYSFNLEKRLTNSGTLTDVKKTEFWGRVTTCSSLNNGDIFTKSEIYVPNELQDIFKKMLILFKHNFLILNTGLKCTTPIAYYNNDNLSCTEKNFQDMDNQTKVTLEYLEKYIINNINKAEKENLITKEIKELEIKYYNEVFNNFNRLYEIRRSLVYNIYIERNFTMSNNLNENLETWDESKKIKLIAQEIKSLINIEIEKRKTSFYLKNNQLTVSESPVGLRRLDKNIINKKP